MDHKSLTLPDLEQKLDALVEGDLFHMLRYDYERLFGTNDAALGRLRNFAKSHACVASFSDDHILLRKKGISWR